MIKKKLNSYNFLVFYFVIIITFSAIKKNCFANNVKDLYLDLMKRCLINHIYQDAGNHMLSLVDYDKKIREKGQDWPTIAHTMIGLKRLNNIQYCMEEVLKKQIPGDFIETGIWRGGAVIFMRSILKAYADTKRIVWAADSFEGVPSPNIDKYPQDKGVNFYLYKQLAINLKEVKENFKRYNLLDNQVKFLKGWFKDTLPNAPIKKIAVLRLDGDLYESTMNALDHLYNKVSIGGYIIVDDYESVHSCKSAINDFRKKHNIKDPIFDIDGSGIFWKKSK